MNNPLFLTLFSRPFNIAMPLLKLLISMD